MLKKSGKKPTVELWQLKRLKPHPLQGVYFADLSDYALADLAADIKANGLKEKIEILPDGTILSGHQRRRALELLGRPETHVIRRDDLAGDEAEAEDFLLRANLMRRQLDPLSQARVALRRFEIEKGRTANKMTGSDKVTARDRIGKSIGMSGRNLQRYWNVLNSPREVQDAFQAGGLTLNEAARVGVLSAKEKEKIATRIRDGELAKAVVSSVLSRTPRKQKVVRGDKWQSFVTAMQIGLLQNREQVEQIAGRLTGDQLKFVRKCRHFLDRVLAAAELKASEG